MRALKFQRIPLLLVVLFMVSAASAQNCPANKIRVYQCIQGSCNTKCVALGKIPTGWTKSVCTGCGSVDTNFATTANGGALENNSFLLEVYPSSATTPAKISFYLDEPVQASVVVIDLNGKRVFTICNRLLDSGEYHFDWYTAQVASGVYTVQIQTSTRPETARVTITN